ncbi:DUF3014 domain-containing protein [Glaciecola sp. KUL10]|uniref:DUF3014 domain-containing protein n=1 Tax=Glaciecola sp. (strain KUL10) TaxID=2161813 RepID=UPI000D783588|nr:DUF3014 domain-containing protein [Glaciecola sp. KUL10]GBL06188.1 hypothetical protein KUL10_35260 [Glaciecola sp. KUL10]
MSQPEVEQSSQLQQMKPYLIAAGALLIILLLAIFWPSANSPDVDEQTNQPIEQTAPVEKELTREEQAVYEDAVKPEVFQPAPIPQAVVIESSDEVEPMVVSEESAPDPIVDESDGAIKQALIDIATSERFASLLVNESLLQKFVVNVYNTANAEAAPNHSLIQAPQRPFQIYQQAEREWIDPASFQRYNVYVDVLESLNTERLITLLDTYRPIIEEKFAEIAPPNSRFNDTLIDAIDELLDTPKAPVPIEVYSDSVMYKFKDDKLENLSSPQKQLLRTGPENMRRIKQVLRDIKDELYASQ